MKTLKIPDKFNITADDIVEICKKSNINKHEVEKIILPESLREIGNYVFYKFSNLKEINFPKNLKLINEYSFAECFSLKHIKLNEGLKSIRGGAFYCCNLKELYIPKTIEEIKDYPFYSNKSLNSIIVSKDNPVYSDMDCNVIYDKKDEVIIQGCNTSTIPESTKIINDYSFYNTKIKNITIPESVKEIKKFAFLNCNLENVTIKGNPVTALDSFEANIKNFYLYSKDCSNIFINKLYNKENVNIYVLNNDIMINPDFYNGFRNKIKIITLDELLKLGMSMKDINKVLKNIKEKEDDIER